MKKYFNNNESEIINALKNAGFTTSYDGNEDKESVYDAASGDGITHAGDKIAYKTVHMSDDSYVCVYVSSCGYVSGILLTACIYSDATGERYIYDTKDEEKKKYEINRMRDDMYYCYRHCRDIDAPRLQTACMCAYLTKEAERMERYALHFIESAKGTEIKDVSESKEHEVLSGTFYHTLQDAPERVQFAAVRDDERLFQEFMSYVADNTESEVVDSTLKAFLHMEYSEGLRQYINRFIANYDRSDSIRIAVNINKDVDAIEAAVSIDGKEGEHIDLLPFVTMTEMAA